MVKKVISTSALMKWEKNIIDNYELKYNEDKLKVIHATCILCYEMLDHLKHKLRWLQDMIL